MSDIVSFNGLTDIGKIVQCDVTFNTDKNNNVNLEGLNISYRSHCDISDNVCLNLQSSCYSTYILFSLVDFYVKI